MEQTDKLFQQFSRYSNEQLELVINSDKYTELAKNTAKYVIEKRKEEGVYESFDDNASTDYSSYQKKVDNYCLQQIANDVRTIKTIMLIFAIISAVGVVATIIASFFPR